MHTLAPRHARPAARRPGARHTVALLLALVAGLAQAETREEAAERRKRESAERREADALAREERRALAAQRQASAAEARAADDARREDLKRRREEAGARARDARQRERPADPSAAAPRPAPAPTASPAPAPAIPGQPTDTELRLLLQSMINREYNQPAQDQARRCNTGAWKDDHEQQFCQGWFMAERARKGPLSEVTMTVVPVTVSALTVRECSVNPSDRVYRCLFNMQVDGMRPFNGGPVPGMTMIDVVRSGGEWRRVTGR